MNFKNLCKIACVFIFLLSVQGNSLAATIHGTVYEWYTFEPLEYSIVEINSTPEQSFVATDAKYSFNLTPGTYKINASYFEENNVVYETEEVVTISDEGEYVHDLLLFPTYEEDLLNEEGFENIDLDIEEEESQSQVNSRKGQPDSQANSQYTILIFASLALCILLLAGYLVKRERRNPPEKTADSPGETQSPNALTPDASESNVSDHGSFTIGAAVSDYAEPVEGSVEEAPKTSYELSSPNVSGEISGAETHMHQVANLPDDSKTAANSLPEEIPDSLSSEGSESQETGLPDDLKEILDLIRANGNRITQRELRKKSPYSESKVSLMLSDLEERGLVEKFKRGRGNIIRIPDAEAVKQGGFQERKG